MPTLPVYQRTIDDVLSQVASKKSGLSDEEAAARLKTYGPNELTVKRGASPLKIYFEQFKNSLIFILLCSTMAILFVYQFGGREQSDLIQAVLIFTTIILITGLGFFQEYKAEKAIESLKKLLAFKAKVLREGKTKLISVTRLVPGDIVVLEEGMKVPADIRLFEVVSLRINEASLTGESHPSVKSETTLTETLQLGDQKNMAFSGTTVAAGKAYGIVVKTGMQTEIGKITTSVAQAVDEETPIQKRLDTIGKLIGIVILAICTLVFIFIVFIAKEFSTLPILSRLLHAFVASVALAVAAIPEGLPAVVTIALAFGTRRMLAKNVLVRKLNAVETLGSTDTICSDKTGTLTKGEMSVSAIYFADNLYQVSGSGYEPKGDFLDNTTVLDKSKLPFIEILLAGFFCNDAKQDGQAIIGDPTEAALLVSALKANLDLSELPRIHEIPFNSERKMMTVVVHESDKYIVFTKGAPEIVLERSYRLRGQKRTVPLVMKDKKEILEINHKLSTSALRTLGFATKVLTKAQYEKQKHDENLLESGLTFLGIQGMRDPARKEVKLLIDQCHQAGINVIMITGDHPETARAVAKEIGIVGKVLTGNELDALNPREFAHEVEHVQIYARVNPDTKLRIIAALQSNGHIVAMTGDGVNDAPALKKADIGIAMGISGTDVAKEASDMVLLDDQFSSIIAAIEEGRGIFHNIKKFVIYLLSCNLAEVMIVLFGVLILQDLVLTATMLLWINVATDSIPAIALGLDPAERGIMRYKPQVFQTQLINLPIWIDMVVFSFFLCVFVLGIYVINLPYGLASAQTAAYTSLIIFEFLTIYLIRSNYRISLFTNKWLFLSILFALSTQAVILSLPLLSRFFGFGTFNGENLKLILLSCIWLFFGYKVLQIALSKLPFAATQSEQ